MKDTEDFLNYLQFLFTVAQSHISIYYMLKELSIHTSISSDKF